MTFTGSENEIIALAHNTSPRDGQVHPGEVERAKEGHGVVGQSRVCSRGGPGGVYRFRECTPPAPRPRCDAAQLRLQRQGDARRRPPRRICLRLYASSIVVLRPKGFRGRLECARCEDFQGDEMNR